MPTAASRPALLALALALAACAPRGPAPARAPVGGLALAGLALPPALAPAPTDATATATASTTATAPAAATATATATAAPEPLILAATPTAPPPFPSATAWIIAGGGAVPADNQLSIEDDLGLAAVRFPGDGILLFAGGPGSHGVQVLDDAPRGDAVVAALADLFDPRGGRNTHYRPTRLRPHGPATAEALLDALDRALAEPGGAPLTLYLAGHGAPAAAPADVQLALWGGRGLVPADLAETLDSALSARPVRFILTSCFSGAFADALFTAADPARGAARPLRCGLFAAPWDRPSSGCDPDPLRRARNGYGAHLLGALALRDANGAWLDPDRLDLDHDGRVSLLEAHTRARLAATGFDVPTTTSERWLRHAASDLVPAPPGRPHVPAALPEEDLVIATLGARLGAPDAAAAERQVATLEAALTALDPTVAAAEADENGAANAAAAAALARWPVLDDPWHPDFVPTLAHQRDALAAWFAVSPEYAAYLDARSAHDAVAAERDDAVVALGPWLTLARAWTTRRLAAALQATGGEAWATFLALRACEAGPP